MPGRTSRSTEIPKQSCRGQLASGMLVVVCLDVVASRGGMCYMSLFDVLFGLTLDVSLLDMLLIDMC